jgi:hypothetical protein
MRSIAIFLIATAFADSPPATKSMTIKTPIDGDFGYVFTAEQIDYGSQRYNVTVTGRLHGFDKKPASLLGWFECADCQTLLCFSDPKWNPDGSFTWVGAVGPFIVSPKAHDGHFVRLMIYTCKERRPDGGRRTEDSFRFNGVLTLRKRTSS